jgi:YidC/Oxa1 family membrane protein insertase
VSAPRTSTTRAPARVLALSLGLSLVIAASGASAQEAEGAPAARPTALPAAGEPVAGEALVVEVPGKGGATVSDHRVRVAVPASKPEIVYTFTERGGTLVHAQLSDPRFTRDALPPFSGVPDERLAAGPIDLVTTWSPRYLPFQLSFRKPEVPGDITLVLRRGRGAANAEGELSAPSDPSALSVDRPVAEGDIVVLNGGSSRHSVTRISAAGVLSTNPPLPAGQSFDFEIQRTGSFDSVWQAGPVYTRVSADPGFPLVYVWPDPATDTSPIYIEKRYSAGQHPFEVQLTVTVHGFGDKAMRLQPGLTVSGWQHPELMEGGMFSFPQSLYAASCQTGDAHERFEFPALAKEPKAFATHTDWVGVDTRYFVMAAAENGLKNTQCELYAAGAPPTHSGVVTATLWADPAGADMPPATGACVPEWLAKRSSAMSCADAARVLGHDLSTPESVIGASWQSQREDATGEDRQRLDDAWGALRARRQRTLSFSLFIGPKDEALLKQTGHALASSLDFGWLAVIAEPLLFMMRWFHGITGHWALAILLLTFVLKLVLLPLTNGTFRSQQKMAKLRPEMDKIQKEFKDDREGAGRAQMALFKREKVNPLSGCLPMLLQMPIWFALYQVILSSVDLYHAPLGLWIHDLSSNDPYYVLPVILGFLMLAQSYLTPTPTTGSSGQQAFLKYGMPAMFSVFMIALPSGLVLYILVNTVLTLIQNLIIRRRMA